jgi:predicted negative regulator of RcsB-dependent stress response
MEVYSTEEQQEEAIKKAIKDNWLVVVLGGAIGLGAVYGWRYYDASVLAKQEADSDAYTAIVEKVGKDDADVIALSNEYIKEAGNKSYTVMLAMVAAKEAVAKKDLDEAAKQLKWAVANSQDDSFKAVNLTRLARIQAEQEKYSDALATLGQSLPKSFTAQVEELKGDIYLKQGDADKARASYQLAADNEGLEGNNGLQFKLDNLAQATPDL